MQDHREGHIPDIQSPSTYLRLRSNPNNTCFAHASKSWVVSNSALILGERQEYGERLLWGADSQRRPEAKGKVGIQKIPLIHKISAKAQGRAKGMWRDSTKTKLKSRWNPPHQSPIKTQGMPISIHKHCLPHSLVFYTICQFLTKRNNREYSVKKKRNEEEKPHRYVKY